MLITPQNITKAILLVICAIGVFTFIFLWAMSGRTPMETCLYIGITAAFALAAVAPYTGGRWLGRMIMMVSFGATIYFPFFGISITDRPTLATVWPGLFLGAIMSAPVQLELVVQFIMETHRKIAR